MVSLKEAFKNRKVIPYRSILSEDIRENSFAVGFQAILSTDRDTDNIYKNPEQFFKLTYMTNNLRGIFRDVLTRVTKGGARPILLIDTTFGGGKTHTLVGLYHMFTNPKVAEADKEIQKVIREAKLNSIPDVSLVAIDCHDLSSVKRKGKARTLWGEIAKQLNCYDLVGSFDQELRRPEFSTIQSILSSSGKPVIIMIDELVNYLKDAKAEKIGDQNLAEITAAFLHTLTDVIVGTNNAMLVLTLPGKESVFEKEAHLLEEFKNYVRELGGRQAPFTVPMDKSEIYEIVQKRLFEFVDETVARQTAEELQGYYARNIEHFPEGVDNISYNEKLRKSYPFHPVLIDILYERISTINEFQQTRGVLRLLANVLKNVYSNMEHLDYDLVITPGLVDFTDNSIFQELTNRIGRGEFQNVIKTDIVNDKFDGKCQEIDNHRRYGPAVRIGTSIYLYTLIGATNEYSVGCYLKDIVLATSVERVTYPKDIQKDLATIENTLWYIYPRNGKWYFSVEVNINRAIYEETQKVTRHQYDPELKKRLRKMLDTDYFDVHIWDHDLRMPNKPTLVVVDYFEIKGSESRVPSEVRNIIEREGTNFRAKKNLVYVLVPREDRAEKMINAAKRFLAISYLKSSAHSSLELKPYISKIDELLKEADSNLNGAIELCYSLIYYPYRTEIKDITVLDGYEGARDYPDKIFRALVKAKKIIESLTPSYLQEKILNGKSEITVNEILSSFEESPSHPLPKDEQVVLDAISEGLVDDGVDNKVYFGLYTSGIGDLMSITESNYSQVSANFYFRRKPSSSPKGAHYVLSKQQAEEIETKLNKISERLTGGDDTSKTRKVEHEIPEATRIDIDKLSKFKEYIGWVVRSMEFEFSNIRVLLQIQPKLSLILLGVSNVKLSIHVRSKQLDLAVKESQVVDINNLMDAVFRISNMYSNELKANIRLTFDSELKVDEDLSHAASDLSAIGDELKFSSELEKS